MNYQAYLKKLLDATIEKGASDLHLCVSHPPVLRINRQLVDLEEKPLSPEDTEGLAFSLISEKQKERFLEEKGLDFGYDFEDQGRFRANFYFEDGNVAMAFRFVPSEIKTIEELNLPSILHRLTEASQGFVLVTGASSQGKSTTLAALIDEINKKRREHIITIEDPVEYVFKDEKSLINQREIGSDALSFPKALRAALREDPDVVMVGEMRDLETISTAITAAETGHLVFATLHTNSASQTIHRIIDVFPSHQQSQVRAQFSSSLLAVISQRLIFTNEGDLQPACEIMFNNSAVSNLIRENRVHEIPSVIETSKDEGMAPLNKSLGDLVRNKIVSKEEAMKYSLDPEDLESRLKKI